MRLESTPAGPGKELSLGEIVELADGLWMVAGEMPPDVDTAPNPANAVVYAVDGRVYVIYSGAGLEMRRSIADLLQRVGPIATATLVNTHSHLDHICNNDLIHSSDAEVRRHFISRVGLTRLDADEYFAQRFSSLEEYFEPLRAYRAHRLKYRIAETLKNSLTPLFGARTVWRRMMRRVFRKFGPARDAREMMRPIEDLPSVTIELGEETWPGWILGDDDVWLLETRAHSPDEVLAYIPRHRLLHTADLTMDLFPTWPDTDGPLVEEMLRRCLRLFETGVAGVLTDGHHHAVHWGAEAMHLLRSILLNHSELTDLVRQVVRERGPLTVPEIDRALDEIGSPTVGHFRRLEYPSSPPTLAHVVLNVLLQDDYEVSGPKGARRFSIPSTGDRERGRQAGHAIR